jgi:hypothetical protein
MEQDPKRAGGEMERLKMPRVEGTVDNYRGDEE